MNIMHSIGILKDVEHLSAIAVLLLLCITAFLAANLLAQGIALCRKMPSSVLSIGSGIAALIFLLWILFDPDQTEEKLQQTQAIIAVIIGIAARFFKAIVFLVKAIHK